LGGHALQCRKRYHAPIHRSVTDFPVIGRQKGPLFCCGAWGRNWPKADASVRDYRGSFRVESGHPNLTAPRPLMTQSGHRLAAQRPVPTPILDLLTCASLSHSMPGSEPRRRRRDGASISNLSAKRPQHLRSYGRLPRTRSKASACGIGVLMAYAGSDRERRTWIAAFREGLQKLGCAETLSHGEKR
jgi:hypothetical protein